MATVQPLEKQAAGPAEERRVGIGGVGPRLAWSVYGIGMLVLALIVLLVANNQYWLNIIILSLLFAGVASGWNVIGGFGGQLSLGHAVYFAIGAYTVGILFTHFNWSPWLSMVLAIPVALLVAGLTSWPTFRLRGPFFAMATLALNEVALVLALYFKGLTGGSSGVTMSFIPSFGDAAFIERWKYAVITLIYVAVAVAIALWISRSRLGYGLRAVREAPEAAASVGFSVLGVKMSGMLISAAVTCLGGSIYAMYVRYLDPDSAFSLADVGVRLVLVCLLGGIGSVMGPVIGALVFVPAVTLLQAGLSGQAPGLNLVVVGALIVAIPLLFRRGIVGTASTLVRKGSRRWGK